MHSSAFQNFSILLLTTSNEKNEPRYKKGEENLNDIALTLSCSWSAVAAVL
jgi:hypothetical protein